MKIIRFSYYYEGSILELNLSYFISLVVYVRKQNKQFISIDSIVPFEDVENVNIKFIYNVSFLKL